MIHLEHPPKTMWEVRQRWFEQKAEQPDDGGYLLSEQACALVADLQCVFCAGARIAVIVLAAAIIDAHLRDAEGCTARMTPGLRLTWSFARSMPAFGFECRKYLKPDSSNLNY